jgi:hypothetical protein
MRPVAAQGVVLEEGRANQNNLSTALIVKPSNNPYDRFQSLPQEKKKRYCGFCSCCCLFGLVTFLLLFYFIPRVPYASYESTTTTFFPYTVTETYKVHNRNMYSLTLSNWDMTVTTTTNLGTFTSGNGVLDDDDNSLVVPANSNREMSLVYVYNITAVQQQSIIQQCNSASGVSYRTTGSVDMELWFHDFNSIDLGPWTSTYFC